MSRILKQGNLSDFIIYLNNQIGQPYVWGGQHTRLTPENYVAVITKKESNATNRANAIKFCKDKFDAGATVLYAYDCSGLGVYWLCDKEHIISTDTTANGLMLLCEDADEPHTGYWTFRVDSETGRATHIGYMVSDDMVVHAKGRAYGVVREHFKPNGRKYWDKVGKPMCFDFDPQPDPPQPEPPEPPTPEPKRYVEVVGKSVRVRASDSVLGRTQFIAHRGDTFPYIGVAPSGWYCIDLGETEAFITNKERYTKLVEK
jgi:hypothetical protein